GRVDLLSFDRRRCLVDTGQTRHDVAEGLQPVVLARAPRRAGVRLRVHAAPCVRRMRAQAQVTGPDSAYSTPTTSRVRGRSITSTAITTGTTSSTVNGTRSARGPPSPLPLKLQ